MILNDRQVRILYWNHFIERYYVNRDGGGKVVTGSRLRAVKDGILANDTFWADVIERHGATEKMPDEFMDFDHEGYIHMLCNFWGMVASVISDYIGRG